jgi:electron transfer flavoprotein beta subunit
MATLEITLPAVLGVQAAARPPRYVPISRLRQVTASAQIVSAPLAAEAAPLATAVSCLAASEQGSRAHMLEGEPEEIAEQIVDVLRERGFVGARG